MYVPLYIKTDYNLLSSLIKIDDLIYDAKKKNITTLAIANDNLYGTMEFITKCISSDIKPIIGLELSLNNNKFLLYAKNYDGYKNLLKLETIKNENHLNFDFLKTYKDNLICICFDISFFDILTNFYEDIFIGVNNNSNDSRSVFINETLYLEKYQYKYLPYIFMIRDGKTISDGINFIYQNNHLLSINEVISMTSDIAISNTIKIANMCNLKMESNLHMPKYKLQNSKEYLKNIAIKGLNKRLNNNLKEEYLNRLFYELDVIFSMHYEDYFLVVYDYIKYAKKNNILVGPGRGSAAGSLVCFCLGITEVDPIKYNLLFERFLNPKRITLPDIDTDFPDCDRDKVINYCVEKYGKKNVVEIITFGTLKVKQAIRDVGRVLNIDMKDIEYLCKNIKQEESLRELKNKDKEVSNYIDSDPKLQRLYNIETLIENNKRHTSIHAAGVVISSVPIDDVVPLTKNGDMYLTEYTMDYLEKQGLIKMDFLGLKNLSVIKNIIIDITKNKEDIVKFFNNIPLDDNNALEIFRKSDTVGIFQFESEGMKRFLKDLKVENFNDICSAIALYRPGPAVNIPSFIKRKQGLEKIDYFDDRLKSILEETYGIIVYQEQIMQIARVMASYDYGDADLLRRAMSKKKIDILEKEKDRFVSNALKNGFSKEIIDKVYNYVLKFANYGFNKSHSVSYSIISYKMAYLKYYYPSIFYSNLLESVIGSDSKTKQYIDCLKNLSIKVLPPDINISLENKYKTTEDSVILPFSSIRNVGLVVANIIILERENGLFKDIFDFLERTYKKINNRKVIESLIYSHSFDNLGYNIKTLIKNLDEILNYIDLSMDLEENFLEKPEIKILKEDEDLVLDNEKDIFGFYLTNHKTEKYKLSDNNITDLADIKDKLNQKVNIIVSLERIKEIVTKTNEKMAFLTVVDQSGSGSVTVFPKKYINFSYKIKDIVKIEGIVQKRYNEYLILLNNITKLNL